MCITSDNKIDLTSTTTIEERRETAAAITWKKYGSYCLTTVHKLHLCTDHLLCDVYMGAAQELIKRQFPHIHEMHNILMQSSKNLKPFDIDNCLQIVRVQLGKIDHWVIISTKGCISGEVELYDSLQQRPSLATQKVIARYLKSPLKSIRIEVINVALQKGSVDCGLYAIAMMTSTAQLEAYTDIYKTIIFRCIRRIYRQIHAEMEQDGRPYTGVWLANERRHIYVNAFFCSHNCGQD